LKQQSSIGGGEKGSDEIPTGGAEHTLSQSQKKEDGREWTESAVGKEKRSQVPRGTERYVSIVE